MKILIYCPKFYPSVGGLEILIEMLANEFYRKGHSVLVLSEEKSIGSKDFLFSLKNKPSTIELFKYYMSCNVFFMPNLSLKGVWPFFLFPFKKLIISHNNCYISGSNKQTWKDYLKLALMYVADNISVSRYISTQIWARSVVIYNCYRTDLFHDKYGLVRNNELLFVGRLVSDKNVDDLLFACKKLWESKLQFKLTIAGDGPMKKWVIDYVRNNSLENYVFMAGTVIGENLARLMNQKTILVVPSDKEPFGIVALEGLATGCRVIVADSGALSEVVGDFGSTFITGNIESLANTIEKTLLECGTKKDDFDNQDLLKYLDMFTPSKIADQYLAIFDKKKVL